MKHSIQNRLKQYDRSCNKIEIVKTYIANNYNYNITLSHMQKLILQRTNLTRCIHERNENLLTGLNSLVGAQLTDEPSPTQPKKGVCMSNTL